LINDWTTTSKGAAGPARLPRRQRYWRRAQGVSTAMLLSLLAMLATGPAARLEQRAVIDWRRLQQLAAQQGEPAVLGTRAWRELLYSAASQPRAAQLQQVNNFFNNRIDWRSDREIWSREDYWATPLELLARGQGDCEDFSVAKYISLLALGVPVQQLRITYVKAQRLSTGSSIAHMVLAYYPEGSAEPMILDNLALDILPASRRTDLRPVFGFNSAGIWVGGESEPRSRDSTAHLSRWRDLLRRMDEAGIPAY